MLIIPNNNTNSYFSLIWLKHKKKLIFIYKNNFKKIWQFYKICYFLQTTYYWTTIKPDTYMYNFTFFNFYIIEKYKKKNLIYFLKNNKNWYWQIFLYKNHKWTNQLIMNTIRYSKYLVFLLNPYLIHYNKIMKKIKFYYNVKQWFSFKWNFFNGWFIRWSRLKLQKNEINHKYIYIKNFFYNSYKNYWFNWYWDYLFYDNIYGYKWLKKYLELRKFKITKSIYSAFIKRRHPRKIYALTSTIRLQQYNYKKYIKYNLNSHFIANKSRSNITNYSQLNFLSIHSVKLFNILYQKVFIDNFKIKYTPILNNTLLDYLVNWNLDLEYQLGNYILKTKKVFYRLLNYKNINNFLHTSLVPTNIILKNYNVLFLDNRINLTKNTGKHWVSPQTFIEYWQIKDLKKLFLLTDFYLTYLVEIFDDDYRQYYNENFFTLSSKYRIRYYNYILLLNNIYLKNNYINKINYNYITIKRIITYIPVYYLQYQLYLKINVELVFKKILKKFFLIFFYNNNIDYYFTVFFSIKGLSDTTWFKYFKNNYIRLYYLITRFYQIISTEYNVVLYKLFFAWNRLISKNKKNIIQFLLDQNHLKQQKPFNNNKPPKEYYNLYYKKYYIMPITQFYINNYSKLFMNSTIIEGYLYREYYKLITTPYKLYNWLTPVEFFTTFVYIRLFFFNPWLKNYKNNKITKNFLKLISFAKYDWYQKNRIIIKITKKTKELVLTLPVKSITFKTYSLKKYMNFLFIKYMKIKYFKYSKLNSKILSTDYESFIIFNLIKNIYFDSYQYNSQYLYLINNIKGFIIESEEGTQWKTFINNFYKELYYSDSLWEENFILFKNLIPRSKKKKLYFKDKNKSLIEYNEQLINYYQYNILFYKKFNIKIFKQYYLYTTFNNHQLNLIFFKKNYGKHKIYLYYKQKKWINFNIFFKKFNIKFHLIKFTNVNKNYNNYTDNNRKLLYNYQNTYYINLYYITMNLLINQITINNSKKQIIPYSSNFIQKRHFSYLIYQQKPLNIVITKLWLLKLYLIYQYIIILIKIKYILLFFFKYESYLILKIQNNKNKYKNKFFKNNNNINIYHFFNTTYYYNEKLISNISFRLYITKALFINWNTIKNSLYKYYNKLNILYNHNSQPNIIINKNNYLHYYLLLIKSTFFEKYLVNYRDVDFLLHAPIPKEQYHKYKRNKHYQSYLTRMFRDEGYDFTIIDSPEVLELTKDKIIKIKNKMLLNYRLTTYTLSRIMHFKNKNNTKLPFKLIFQNKIFYYTTPKYVTTKVNSNIFSQLILFRTIEYSGYPENDLKFSFPFYRIAPGSKYYYVKDQNFWGKKLKWNKTTEKIIQTDNQYLYDIYLWFYNYWFFNQQQNQIFKKRKIVMKYFQLSIDYKRNYGFYFHNRYKRNYLIDDLQNFELDYNRGFISNDDDFYLHNDINLQNTLKTNYSQYTLISNQKQIKLEKYNNKHKKITIQEQYRQNYIDDFFFWYTLNINTINF